MMKNPWIRPVLLITIAVWTGGCRCPTPCCVPATPVAPCSFQEALPASEPPDVASLVGQLCEAELCEGYSCERPSRLPSHGESYDLLDAKTCQCNACTNATVANLTDLERHWASVLICCEEGAVEEAICLTRNLLTLQSAEHRNQAAGSALTTYYLLAAAEVQDDYLERGIAEVTSTLERVDSLEQASLPAPEEIDRGGLMSRRTQLLDQRQQLKLARIQLNGQLKRLLGCPIETQRLFWPQVDWTPCLEPLDFDAVVYEGLLSRTDVRTVQLVRCKLSRATLPVARAVLKVADSTLGTVEPAPGIIHQIRCGECEKQEIPIRCRQLTLLANETQRVATAKIKSAAFKVMIQQDRVRLAKEAVDSTRMRLAELEKMRDAKNKSVFQISASRVRVFEAEAELVKQIADLKVAEVALRQERGDLCIECGYQPSLCGEFCCTGCCGRHCGCTGGCGTCCESCNCCDSVECCNQESCCSCAAE